MRGKLEDTSEAFRRLRELGLPVQEQALCLWGGTNDV